MGVVSWSRGGYGIMVVGTDELEAIIATEAVETGPGPRRAGRATAARTRIVGWVLLLVLASLGVVTLLTWMLLIDETDRRRERQIAYNKEHGIDPQPLRKKIADITDALIREGADTKAMLNRKDAAASKNGKGKSSTPNLRREGIAAEGATQLEAMISDLSDQMLAAAGELKFELAARLRDELQDLKKELRAMERAGHA